MADQLGNISKAQRIGGKGSIRRKLKGSKSTRATQADISAVLLGFKKNLIKASNVTNFSIGYKDSVQVFKSPEVKVIMADKKSPVAYVVTGRSKMIGLKKQEEENEGNKNDQEASQENLKDPELAIEEACRIEETLQEVEDID